MPDFQLNSDDADARCAQAYCDTLQKRLDSAIGNLELAIQHGSGIIERAQNESDFGHLEGDRRCQDLLKN